MIAQSSPILVTGAHRTGTTWVGKMLSANPQTAYISEPLNVLHRPGVLRACVNNWYAYITEKNENAYLGTFNELFGYHYHLFDEIKSLRSSKDFLRMGRDLGIFLRGRTFHQRPLLKDPFAVFSLPWFAERLNCQVVVTVRHPAGFASSLKRLNWPFDFNELVESTFIDARLSRTVSQGNASHESRRHYRTSQPFVDDDLSRRSFGPRADIRPFKLSATKTFPSIRFRVIGLYINRWAWTLLHASSRQF